MLYIYYIKLYYGLMDMINYTENHFDLYENDEYDPLDDPGREQLFNDKFWTFPEATIEDLARQASPSSLPDLY